MNRLLTLAAALLTLALPCLAGPTEQKIPLRDGILRTHDLNAVLCEHLHLPKVPGGTKVNLCSPNGAEFLFAVNSCLWRSCRISMNDPGFLVVRFDQEEAEDPCNAMRRIARVYFAEKAPHATAAQARSWGLKLPPQIDPAKPLVILIHGLGSDLGDCQPMAQSLEQTGLQVACFGYPADQAIVDSAALLARHIRRVQMRYPSMPIDLVAHSMGGLVAREFVESPVYTGGVDHLVLVGTPNGGSDWGRLSTMLSLHNHNIARCCNADWHWTWFVTEGIGEAGRDLLPGSDFLKQLNSRPRRTGVQYTIIAGNQSSVDRFEADYLEQAANWVPQTARNWWGLRSWHNSLEAKAQNLRHATGEDDGPVSLASTHLDGVADQVVLPADHISLYIPMDGKPPAALPVVLDRLKRS